MLNYNIPVVAIRGGGASETRIEMMAVVDSKMLFLPVDADIEEGDRVEQELPNGKVRTMHVTRVNVLQSPFGTGSLDHTEAEYSTHPEGAPTSRGGDTYNVRGTNVQVATGNSSTQTMTVGQTADEVVLVVRGIGELLQALSLVREDDAEFAEVQRAAVDSITGDDPDSSGIRRFREWVIACVKSGSTAAVVAAVTAASNGLLHDPEELVRALNG